MTEVNMNSTIKPKSDQLNADDLIGGPRTITVTRVSANEGGPEQPVNVFFEGDDGKPFRPSKSMRRVMVSIWGPDAASYVGRSMTIWRDPTVKWGGMAVGGIRISHMSDMEREVTLALTETRASRKPYVVKPLKVEKPAPQQKAETRDDALPGATAEAKKGKAAFTAWWQSNAGRRDLIRADLPDLQRMVEEADAPPPEDSNDPFGLPPLDDKPRLTPEEEAAIKRKIDEQNAGEVE